MLAKQVSTSSRDFLGFFEIPNIKNDTVFSAKKYVFRRFNLPYQKYDLSMLGKNKEPEKMRHI